MYIISIKNLLKDFQETTILCNDGSQSTWSCHHEPKYHEKCLELLNTDPFTKLNHDPTKKTEAKIQREK